jgi:serine/threonine-protein kinase
VEPVPVLASGPALASAELRRADMLEALGKTARVLGVLVLVGLGAELLGRHGWLPSPAPPPPPVSSPLPAPEASSGKVPAPAGGVGGEMARKQEPSEADGAAAPPRADTTPAAKDDPSVKTPRKTPRPDKKPWGRAACAGLAGQALQACVAAQQAVAPVVYSAPPSLACPAGAVRTMEDTLHIPISKVATVVFRPFGDRRGVGKQDVRQSATVRTFEALGKLEGGTVLTGRLFFTADRIHGLFTEAKTEDGTTYPVCLELVRCLTRWVQPGGVEREDVGGPADSAVIFSTQCVRAVEQFPNKP